MRSEQGSPFANELSIILNSYLLKTLRTFKLPRGDPDPYDFTFFNSLVPHSILAKELIQKFVDTPNQAYDDEGMEDPDWENAPARIKKKREKSCVFNDHAQIKADEKPQSINQPPSTMSAQDESLIRK